MQSSHPHASHSSTLDSRGEIIAIQLVPVICSTPVSATYCWFHKRPLIKKPSEGFLSAFLEISFIQTDHLNFHQKNFTFLMKVYNRAGPLQD